MCAESWSNTVVGEIAKAKNGLASQLLIVRYRYLLGYFVCQIT